MHTRYAPVRRSQSSKLLLPLDLHVLSLPLAFILSQDQTLHRILFKLNKFSFVCIRRFLLVVFFESYRFYYSLICFEISFKTAVNSICLGTCLNCLSLVSQSGCKSTTSFLSRKYIWKFFIENYFSFFLSFYSLNLFKNLSPFRPRINREAKIITFLSLANF